MNRLFSEFELPLLPTLVVGCALLIAVTAIIVSHQPMSSHNQQIEGAGAFWKDTGTLVVPDSEIDSHTLFASKWIARRRGASELKVETPQGDVIATCKLP